MFSPIIHTRANRGVPRQPYEAVRNVLYMKKHSQTYASYPTMDISCMTSSSVDLEVEGVRYIELHRGPVAYVLGPPPSRVGDLELEGEVNACLVKYLYDRTIVRVPRLSRERYGVIAS